MNDRLFSLCPPPPPGFLARAPTKRELLGRSVALWVTVAEDATALLADFTERVSGVLVRGADEVALSRLGPSLFWLEAPWSWVPALAGALGCALDHLDSVRAARDELAALRVTSERTGEMLVELRSSYDLTTEELTARIEDLRSEAERRQLAEATLRHAEKMRVVGQLASGVAHDFNNLLAGVLGAAELLRTAASEAERAEYVDIIVGVVERARSLTGQLLGASRRDSALRREPVDVHQLVSEVQALLARSISPSIAITTDLRAKRSVIMGDASSLHTALLNLAVNAVQAMPGGGVLTFRTLDAARSPHSSDESESLEILVIDSGEGMTEEVMARVFEPFFTTKPTGAGTGLGLTAVDAAVQAHAGRVAIASVVGAGTTVRVSLPGARPPSHVAPGAPPAKSGGRGRLLVVDDDEIVRVTSARRLEAAGYVVKSAPSGEAAVAAIAADVTGIDAVILDLAMPGMNGATCFRRLRELRPGLPIILSSGHADARVVEPLLAAGNAAVVHKPWDTDTLVAAVEQVTARQSASRLPLGDG